MDTVKILPVCLCEHDWYSHSMAMAPACQVLINKRNILLAKRCGCKEYRPDNLKMLEAIAFRNGY